MTATLNDEVAELRRANAELQRRLDEALAREAATAEVLQVIKSSPGDLAPVFDAILQKATRLCGAATGHVVIFDGEMVKPVAVQGDPGFVEWVRQRRIHPLEPSSIADRMRQGESTVHIPDSTDTDLYRTNPTIRELIDRSGVRTTLGVALRKDNVLLGGIFVTTREVRPFTDKQVALLQNFAAQAVIAIENARLLTETREALEQQTATAEVLQVINGSPGDLAPVFDAMLEKAVRLCDAAFGTLFTYGGDSFLAVALHDVPAAFAAILAKPVHPSAGGALDRLLHGEGSAHFADVSVEDAYATGPDARRMVVELGGARSLLAVPLRKEDEFLGAFVVYRQEVRPFSDKQIALLENFAAQAVIAMENARLLTETREALEQQTATAEVLQVINSSLGDLAPVFDAIVERAMRLCDAAFAMMNTFDGEMFHIAALRGVPARLADELGEPRRADDKRPVHQRLVRGESLIHIADVSAGESQAWQGLAELGGARTVVWLALRKDGRLLGTLTAYRQEVRPFAEKELALLQNFAAQAVIAMENVRLINETREALEQQTATAEVLGVINSSPGDLAPVFDAMLDKALRLCGADFGALRGFDGDAFPVLAVHGLATHGAIKPEPDSALGRLLRGENVVHIPDVIDTDGYRSGLPSRIALVQNTGARTALWVALRKEQELRGAFIIYRREVRPFTDKQIALLESFAQQAVIAMENARLLGELHQRTDEVAELNRGLEARVAEQVDELGRVGRLKRFLAPQLAELIVSQGDEKILESHRREIVVVFCDLRGYTAFTETAEPEEVLEFLREYHGALGPLVSQFEGTLAQFSGDGIMVFFNDPVPCADPAERAVKMAMAMREAAGRLIADWRRHSYELGFGAGIAQGFATLGQIGFSERSGYTAIGTVCNLAARLCAEAKDGQILVSSRIAGAVETVARLEDLGNLELKGFRRPVAAFNVAQSASAPTLVPI